MFLVGSSLAFGPSDNELNIIVMFHIEGKTSWPERRVKFRMKYSELTSRALINHDHDHFAFDHSCMEIHFNKGFSFFVARRGSYIRFEDMPRHSLQRVYLVHAGQPPKVALHALLSSSDFATC